MSENKLTQLYDKNGNELFPNIPLKTINGKSILAEGSPIEDDYEQKNNIIIATTQSKMKIVYVYKVNEEKPEKPVGGFITEDGVFNLPDGWFTEDEIDKNTIEGNLWRSYATLIFGGTPDDSEWSNPSLINEVDAGADGRDGTDIKLIYCLTKEFEVPTSSNYTGDTFVDGSAKGEWREDAMGVDDVWKYEWVSMSIKESGYNNIFGAFSTPTLWAKWSDDGRDGAGVEYIYCLNNDNEAPSLEFDIKDTDYQKPEYKPTGWTDDYNSPTYDNRFSWVAIRHFKDGSWGGFSQPKLWNIYKVAGKSFADLYRRSDYLLSATDLPKYQGYIYYVYSTDKYYEDASLNNEITNIGEWHTDIPDKGGKYLFKTQAYVDIIDIEVPVLIDDTRWSGPYFVSVDGKDGVNAIVESAYISMNNDSFSLPINDSHKTFNGIEYKDSLSAKLMYGDDELYIKSYDISYSNKFFDYVNASISSDNKSLNVDIKIKNDVEFTKVEEIILTLTGDYNDKEYTIKKSFRVIPYISTIGEFFKIRINDDTVYVDPDGCVEKNGDIWKHTITIDLVDNKGNYIETNTIGCKFVYENKNETNVDISNGKINIKNCLDKEIENYIDVINLPNPLIIKLVDNDTNIVREVEYIDFINMPQDGEAGKSNRMVFAYCSSEQQPSTPIGGGVNFETNEITYPGPDNWGPSQNLSGVVWLSTREFFSDGTQDESWTTPMRITGEQGLPGEDGTKLEFAYHLCENENIFSNLNKPEGDINYFPESGKDASKWTDNPQGIDTTYIIEACSQRTCNENNEWSEWSKPFIWSRWGEDGTDGDGVEYIFKIFAEKQENCYPLSDEAYENDNEYVKNILQENDFVPNEEYVNRYIETNEISDDNASILHNLFDKEWTDEPRDVGVSEPYEYVSIRRKKNGIWGSFSKATLWNEWHRDGYNTYTEFAFAAIPSNETLVGYDVSGGTYDKPLEGLITYNTTAPTQTKDVSWSDTLPEYDENKSIWMISAFFSEDEKYENNGKWTSPKKMTDSQTLQVEYCDSSINPADGITEMSDLVTTYPALTLEELEKKFRELESSRGFIWGDENIVNPNWMATSRRVNGNWSNWVVTKIKGEKGEPGAKGDPGTSVQFKGSFNSIEELQAAYEYYRYKEGDQPTPYFTDNNLSSGDGYLINGELWVYDGTGEDFELAWINVGHIKGDKGDSVYLYIAYSNDGGKTFTPALQNGRLGSTPGKYIGICISNIEKSNDFPTKDNINDFTWSKWQGDDGFGVEQIFILHDSSILEVPSTEGYSVNDWNAQDFKPTGWSDIPLTPTITYPYCLMGIRNYPPKDKDVSNGYNMFRGDEDGNAIVFSYLAKDGVDGASSYHIELSNDFDLIYAVDGKVNGTQIFETDLQLLLGNLPVVIKDVSVNNIDNDIVPSITYSDDNKTANIKITLEDNKEISSNINAVIKVTYESEYDTDNNDDEIYTYFTLKPINDESLYQIQATPSFITRTQDTSVFVKLYRKGKNGLELMSEIPNDIRFKYSLDNSTNEKDITNVSINNNNQIKVYDWKSTDALTKEIDIRLYKGDNLHDNVNIEIKEDVKPSAIFDIVPSDIVMYLDSRNKPINVSQKLKYSFIYEGTECKIDNVSISCNGYINDEDVKYEDISIGLSSKQLTIEVKENANNIEQEGTYSYTITATYKNIEYHKTIYITFISSNLTVSSLFDTITIPSTYKTNDTTYSTLFNFDVYFNEKRVSEDVEITIDIEKITDSSLKTYLEDTNNFYANMRTSTWYLNFKFYSDRFDLYDYIDNKEIKEPIIPFKFTYNGISVTKNWYLSATEFTNGYYVEINSNTKTITADNNDKPVEIYFEYDSKIITLSELYNKNIIFAYSIDGADEIIVNNDIIDYIPISRGNYAFYPNGLQLVENDIVIYKQEPILKNIDFKLIYADKVVEAQSVERVDFIKNSKPIKLLPTGDGISLSDIFDGDIEVDGYEYIVV